MQGFLGLLGHARCAVITIRRLSTLRAMVRYLGQREAQDVDVQLMGPKYAYSVHQLMELAGLSVATALAKETPIVVGTPSPRILVVCGPGNNGGDGLVAARHLKLFGYAAEVLYPKRTDKQLYKDLTTQCVHMNIPVLDEMPSTQSIQEYAWVLDAIFGFSFQGDVRAPFDTILARIRESKTPVCAVDIPSGWDVEQGNCRGVGVEPRMLVSLTAPKLCAKEFTGIHYLGGRFVPPQLAKDFQLDLPPYPSTDVCVRI